MYCFPAETSPSSADPVRHAKILGEILSHPPVRNNKENPSTFSHTRNDGHLGGKDHSVAKDSVVEIIATVE